MKKVLPMLASAALLALTGTASAQEPVTLTSAQMDGVTAGADVYILATSIATSGGAAFGNIMSSTTVGTNSIADPTGVLTGSNPSAQAVGASASLAYSGYSPGIPSVGAYATSTSNATASLQ
ncbi:MAG: hypothetical protein ACU4EQ_10565 [Candidatus Nitrosoglobus sp.]|jgi:hypothetical protein